MQRGRAAVVEVAADFRVGVAASESDDVVRPGGAIPQGQRALGAIQDQGEALGRAEPIGEEDARQRPRALVSPLAVAVQPFDAVEVSTSGGHVIALDLARAPYPLRGEPGDVLEDLQRLGAMAIVAHPTSLKADLVWHDADRPFDGVETAGVRPGRLSAVSPRELLEGTCVITVCGGAEPVVIAPE